MGQARAGHGAQNELGWHLPSSPLLTIQIDNSRHQRSQLCVHSGEETVSSTRGPGQTSWKKRQAKGGLKGKSKPRSLWRESLQNGEWQGAQTRPLRGLELGRWCSWTGRQVGHFRKGLKRPTQELGDMGAMDRL